MTTTTPNTVKLGMTDLEVSPIAFGASERVLGRALATTSTPAGTTW
jgi:hypothetical protein